MNPQIARLLTSLYPRRWRERYEAEFLHFLGEQSPTIHAVLNVIGSALHQRLLASRRRHSIFSSYTEPARRSVFFARHEAWQSGSSSIEPEHLLLGLLREDARNVTGIFTEPSTIPAIIHEVKANLTVRKAKSPSSKLTLSLACKRILGNARDEADSFNHPVVGNPHLLLGILRENQTNASHVLMKYGLDLASTREKISRLLHDR